MKRTLLLSSIAALFLSLLLLTLQKKPSTPITTPLALHKIPKTQRISDALEWRFAKLINGFTGTFNLEDYQLAVQKADAMKLQSAQKKGLLNLTWEAVGPDNFGGRTRAILYDKTQEGTIWIGGVSGGLFKSVDRGRTWNRVQSYTGFGPIASLAQDDLGNLYVGTGEGLSKVRPAALNNGTSLGTSSFGNGIFKSTDGGVSWYQLPGTVAAANGSLGGNSFWAEVNSLAIHPMNANIIFAAGRMGLKYSIDAGEDNQDWNYVPGLPFTTNPTVPSNSNIESRGMVVEISKNGEVAFAVLGAKLYRSNISAVPEDLVNLPWSQIGANLFPDSSLRADVAISPSNPNVIYASFSSECLDGIYRSQDKGFTWTQIKDGGVPFVLDPFNQPTGEFGACDGQGFYDHTLAVNPVDENKIYIGGISFYVWGQGYGFVRADRIGSEQAGPFDSDFIHADKHEIVFDPFDPSGNRMLVGSDGGITECNNANTGFPNQLEFIQRNKNYQSLQVYGMGAGSVGEVFAGSQDNGSLYVDGLGGSVHAAVEVTGGDGIYAEISNFDPDVLFSGVYYGQIYRSINRGESANAFLDNHIDQSSCNRITCSNTVQATDCGSVQDAPFVYPIYLLETSDVTFQDTTASLRARNDTLLLANGGTLIILDTLYPTYTTTTSILRLNGVETIEKERIEVAQYQAVSKVSDEIKIDVNLSETVYPGQRKYFNDPYDAKYFVTSNCNLWMCTNPLQKLQSPVFYKVSGSNTGVKNFDASKDGNHLYYITSNRLYIVSGLNLIHQSIDPSGCHLSNCTTGGLTVKQVVIPLSSSSPGLEGVAVDKNNPNTVLVSQGGFQAAGKVWRVENALSNSPTVIPLQSTATSLPFMPIYSCLIDEGNSNRYLLGTELGIWSSDDAGMTWSEENFGMDIRMPVYSLRQEYLYEKDCQVIYAGTHGGGMYRCIDLMSGGCDPVPFQWDRVESALAIRDLEFKFDFSLFPNPTTDQVQLAFDLTQRSDVKIYLSDLSGKLVLKKSLGILAKDAQTHSFNLAHLSRGNYFVSISLNGKIAASKLLMKQ